MEKTKYVCEIFDDNKCDILLSQKLPIHVKSSENVLGQNGKNIMQIFRQHLHYQKLCIFREKKLVNRVSANNFFSRDIHNF